MSRTARDLVESAYGVSGVLGLGATPKSHELNAGITELNNLIETLDADGLWPYHQSVNEFTLVSGQATYTIGDGGDFDIARPTRINSVSVIIGDTSSKVNLVTPLDFANYSRTSGNTGVPSMAVYRQTFPLGELEFYPAIGGSYGVVIVSDSVSSEYEADDVLLFPRGYVPAVQWLLAEVLADMADLPSPQVSARAAKMLNTIEALNATPSLLESDNSQSYSGGCVGDMYGAVISGGWG